jgi:esterase/lipase
VRKSLANISTPTLLIYSNDDPTVKVKDGHLEAIFTELGSLDKAKILIGNCAHVITEDAQRQTVFQIVGDFVNRVSSCQGLNEA